MTKYKKGQRVRVELEGEIVNVHPRVDHESSRDSYVIRPDRSLPAGGTFWTYAEHVTPLDPADWPPQVGDIWGANGEEYYVRDEIDSSDRPAGRPVVASFTGARFFRDNEQGHFKALNPVLVRRRGR